MALLTRDAGSLGVPEHEGEEELPHIGPSLVRAGVDHCIVAVVVGLHPVLFLRVRVAHVGSAY